MPLSYRIATCIPFPWSARRTAAQPRTKRGTKAQGALVRVSPDAALPIMRFGGQSATAVSEINSHSSSTLGVPALAASVAPGRRAVPAVNPDWYGIRDVSDPLCGPATVPRRVPRVAHVPAAFAHV